jgi:4-amino-4-deoxy-L-arabinose transferase-like glycosyltransferase
LSDAPSEKVSGNPSEEAPASSAPVETPVAVKEPLTVQIKNYLFEHFSSFNIGHLLLLLLGLHLFAMSFPSANDQMVFDEAYYVPASKDLLALVPSNLEHPFFGKIWGALGIYLFGSDFFGWRIFYVLIGVAAVWAMYELALVFFSKEKALLAASLLAFETLFFIHTSLLLLEGPPILFALLGFLGYFKKHYYLAAICFGLSILSKEWGIYFVFALFLYHVWATRHEKFGKLFSGKSLKTLLVFVLLVVVVVGVPLQIYDIVYHPYRSTITTLGTVYVVNNTSHVTVTTTNTTITHSDFVNFFWENFIYYYTYHTGLTLSNSDAANPWDHIAWYWILPYKINPSQYYVTTVTVTTTSSNGTVLSKTFLHPIDWQGIGNLVIWWSIWIIVPVIIFKAIRRQATQLDALIAALLIGTYVPNLILSSPLIRRVVYAFYFINTDPALVLGIPMVITFIAPDSIKLQRVLMALWLGAAILFFILFFPVHPLDFR